MRSVASASSQRTSKQIPPAEDRLPKNPLDRRIRQQADAQAVFVEIDAKLTVVKPTLFAITVENPGGVVVSSRERLRLLVKAN